MRREGVIGASIRTPDQRLRVFVSWTLGELAAERAAVREAIERLQLTPVLFELVPPALAEQHTVKITYTIQRDITPIATSDTSSNSPP
jgi:hypothetical protein